MHASNWYFYDVELEGKRITLPISGLGLALQKSAFSVIDKALEIASRDACCSQQSIQKLHEQDLACCEMLE
ncbi:hypothetical protein ACFLU4_01550 [Chloroflexota bacterium]